MKAFTKTLVGYGGGGTWAALRSVEVWNLPTKKGLELADEERIERDPAEIWRRSAVITVEEQSDTFVDEPYPERIGGKTELIRFVLGVPGQRQVLRKTEIVVGEVGKQRRRVGRHAAVHFARRLGVRATIQVAGIADRFAAEQVVTARFRRGQGGAASQVGVEFRRERTDGRRDFVGGDRLSEFIESLVCAGPICRAQG